MLLIFHRNFKADFLLGLSNLSFVI